MFSILKKGALKVMWANLPADIPDYKRPQAQCACHQGQAVSERMNGS